jgi:tRNA dimethylallyltransferase
MIVNGLFDEAERLFPMRSLNALQTVGYQEIFGFLEGRYDREEAIRLLKRNTRRYAKRQMTWFRKDKEIKWFLPTELERIISYVLNETGHTASG